MTPDREKLLHLLEIDYKNTNDFIKGVVGTSATIRGWSITLSLALLGVAFDRHLWQVAGLTIVFILTFALIDAYHSWLYSQGLAHAAYIEKVFSLYYVSMTRGQDDADAVEEFETELEVFRFGLTSSLRRFRLSSLLQARPRLVLIILYSVLILASVASIGLILLGSQPAEKTFVCNSVGKPGANQYRCIGPNGK